MKIGVSWYPEHVGEDRWASDAARMRDAGITLVRVAEFAWADIEPSRGQFRWEWLDRAVETLAAHGLKVIMCTPTAVPPVWLVNERPDIVAVREDGRPWSIGTRRHTSFSSNSYRDESSRITLAMASRYGPHPAIVAWQLDNEPGNTDTGRCWSAEAEARFREWLRTRYETVDHVNAAWGMSFWSGTYPDFESILLPRTGPERQSPSLNLAHRRFVNEEITSFISEQAEIVAHWAPGRDICTNHHLSGMDTDARAIGGLTGLTTHNCYPQFLSEPLEVSYVHNLCRATAGPPRRGWVMEHQPGPVNWLPVNPAVAPGQVRMWMWQAAMQGIEAFVFFTWRMSRTGQEQYHAALRTHDDEESRGGREARETAAELGAQTDLFERPTPRIALLHSYDDAFALQVDPHRQGFRLRDLQMAAYGAIRRLGHEVDVIDEADDWSGYEVVIATGLHLHDAEREGRLRAAVGRGQLVVLGPRSLVRDREHGSTCQPLPTGLTDLLGARIADSWSRLTASDETLETYGGAAAGIWTDSFQVDHDETEVLATYGSKGYLAGMPAAVRRKNLVATGCASQEAWVGLLAPLVGGNDLGQEVETFHRAGRTVVLNHRTLEVEIN